MKELLKIFRKKGSVCVQQRRYREQKKTGDSVLLFVASSTASQFHFT